MVKKGKKSLQKRNRQKKNQFVAKANKDKAKKHISPVDQNIKQFIASIEGLAQSLPSVMLVIELATAKAEKNLIKFTEKNSLGKVENDGRESYKIPFEKIYEFKKLVKENDWLNASYRLIPSSFVVSLVSQYDAYLGDIVRSLLKNNPKIIHNTDKLLSYSELSTFNSVDEIHNFFIDKKIEMILRENHVEQFKILSTIFGININPREELLHKFVELTERRNLFVHCNGIVSDQYIKQCKNHSVDIESKTKCGNQLTVTPKYFFGGFECVFEIGFTLGHCLWRQQCPDELEYSDENILEVIFDLLCYEMYNLAETIARFAYFTLKKHSSDLYKRMFAINGSLAMKLGKKKNYIEFIEVEDWSATDDRFNMAILLLNERWEDAAKFMKKIGPKGAIAKESYVNWPLFKEFREKDLFKETFESIFKESFTLIESEESAE